MKILIKKIILFIFGKKRLMQFLLKLDNFVYSLISSLSVNLEPNRLHPKHRLIRYHDFFVKNMKKGDIVLDIGCGNGALLFDVVKKTQTKAVGIELDKRNIKIARQHLQIFRQVGIIDSDIFEYINNFQEKTKFTVIILSNILEHLDNRIELLKQLKQKFSESKFLIRVPQRDREWLVPYKEERGIDSRLDTTHKLEYTKSSIRRELMEGGLKIEQFKVQWGEFYIIAS